jgi:ABC-2 type transport system permease protein
MLIQMGLFGAAFVGFTIIADWRVGVVERLRVTPVSRLAILAGRLLRDVLTLLVQAVVLVLVGLAFGMRAPVAGVLIGFGFVAVVAVSLAAVSYTVGLLTKSEDVLAPLLNMVVVPIMLLSGILLPMTLGPGWLQGIARATPFRYIIDAMREAYAGPLRQHDHDRGDPRLGRLRGAVPVDRLPRLRARERPTRRARDVTPP